MKTLITGAGGQLGSELCRLLGPEVVGLDRRRLDITQAELLNVAIAEHRPSVVINTAAATGVDQAEDDPRTHRLVNSEAVEALAAACASQDCLLVHVSTDYVFGGDFERRQPYREEDEPEPLGVYGRMKLAGERHAAQCPRHLIVRTCGLYGRGSRPNRSPNFVERMLRLGSRGGRISVVNDQHCTPTYAAHVAGAIQFLIDQRIEGTYHVVNRGQTTWHAFAQTILRLAGSKVSVVPITSEEYEARAPRPFYSVLDTSKYRALGGPEMPSWKDGLAEYLASREAPG